MAGISEKELLALKAEGFESPMIDYRLEYVANESVLKYLRPLVGLDEVHCHYLPTQKSGRWSTTNPPLPNFSIGCISPVCTKVDWHVARSTRDCWSLRDLVVPRPNEWVLKFDWEAIEAKIAAASCGDTQMLELFESGADVHVVNLCSMFGLPLPPDIMDPHGAESCKQWRADLLWGGKDDWRRVAAKTCLYGLTYAVGATGILEAKDVDELGRRTGLDKKGLVELGQKYLNSKPKLVSWKYSTWSQIIQTSEVRTFLGRRKRLFVSDQERQQWIRSRRPGDACKQGLNHLAQGSVADLMNLTINAIKQQWPSCRLGYQSHDGLLTFWPNSVNPWPMIRNVVEKQWKINNYPVKFTATWGRVLSDGTKEDLN